MAYSANKVINDLEAKTTPVDADSTVIGDSADTNRVKKTTWANIKATLKTYFDTLYGTIASPTFTGTVTTPAIIVSSETASTIASFDASKNVKSLATATYPSLTELSYVKGVTSALQTQINAKAGTLSGTNNEIAYFNSSSTIASLTTGTYPSLTELSYVKGVTSAIQTQLSSIPDASLVIGVGNATATKTYNNFQLPWLLSTDVPTANFWTTTNRSGDLGIMGYYFGGTASADSANSIITTKGIAVKITSGSATELAFGDGKDVICEFTYQRTGAANEQAGFGFVTGTTPLSTYNDTTTDAACFTIDTSGNLYGHTCTGAAQTNSTAISGVTLTNNNTYRIEVNDGVDVKFYVNGVLKATNSTNLPNTGTIKFGVGCSGNGNDNDRIVMGPVSIAVEK